MCEVVVMQRVRFGKYADVFEVRHGSLVSHEVIAEAILLPYHRIKIVDVLCLECPKVQGVRVLAE